MDFLIKLNNFDDIILYVFIDLKMGPERMTSCQVICHFIFFINQMIVVVYNSLICNIPQILYLVKVGTF